MQNGPEDGPLEHVSNNNTLAPASPPPHDSTEAITAQSPIPTQHVPSASSDHETEGPTAKRRKVVGAEPSKSQRPPSPPWKPIHVEGPSTFHEGGVRKSARTNYVPIDLQPRSDKRRTRGTVHQGRAPNIKSKYGGAATSSTEQSSTAAPVNGVNGHQGPTSQIKKPLKTSQKLHKHVSSAPNHFGSGPPSMRTISKREKKAKSGEPPQSPHEHSSQGQKVRKVGRPRRSSTSLILPASATSDGRQESLSNGHLGAKESSTLPKESPSRPQRLNLRFNIPPVGVYSIGNIAKRQETREGDKTKAAFSSFQEWVDNEGRYDVEEKDKKLKKIDLRLSDAVVESEASVRHDIMIAARSGGLLSRENCSYYHKEDKDQVPRLYTHQDRLLAHMSRFNWLMMQERKRHLRAAKECAHQAATLVQAKQEAVYQDWKSKQPKTAEEIAQEQQELFRGFYIQLLEDVKVKWQMVSSEVDELRMQRWQAEQDRIGKEALNNAIEKSKGLLSKRRRRHSGELDEDVSGKNSSGSQSTSGSATNTEDDDADDDDSNMSSSGSESDTSGPPADDDSHLTQAQLRSKYALPDNPSSAPPSCAGSNVVDRERTSLHELERQSSPMLPDSPKAFTSASQPLEDIDPVLMDDSNDSTDMDDDSESSEADTADDSQDGSDQSMEDDGFGMLGGFLSKAEKESLALAQAAETEKEPSPDFETSDDEADKVSLIPDVAQAPTPSASNSEDPLQPAHDVLSPTHAQLPSEDKASQSLDADQPLIQEIPDERTDLGHDDIKNSVLERAEAHDDLPVSPVSVQAPKIQIPNLLRGTLREYQHYGLEWLAGLYSNGTNGILADEMGLGKTIQTISLLAHLAEKHEAWGPHLIVVPTSVMLNWEMEFKKFLPGFKVLTYYGTQEERRRKRAGWTDNDKWNVWITSYTLITQDQQVFKRKAWHYMILDEAHNIKNFQSLRWQTLLTFRTRARLLLTGTPLQNNLTELWSLLYFLMPSDDSGTGVAGFTDLEAFTGWFKRPTEQILEQGKQDLDLEARVAVRKLHDILRPYLLRRLKADVEKQMPGKYEHVVTCRLSKRQRYLYDGFMSRAQTRETLASGNTFSIMNALMQLRKVCNHPDLFETRQIVTSFAMPKSAIADFEIKELLVRRKMFSEPITKVDLNLVNLLPGENEVMSALDTVQKQRLGALGSIRQLTGQQGGRVNWAQSFDGSSVQNALAHFENNARRLRYDKLHQTSYLTSLRSQRRPLFSYGLMNHLRYGIKSLPHQPLPSQRSLLPSWFAAWSPALHDMVHSVSDRSTSMDSKIQKFTCVTPAVVATDMVDITYGPRRFQQIQELVSSCPEDPFHEARVRQSIAFPDKRLLQYDCGKLQELDRLMRTLQSSGHRVLIFTQMTRVLDILEQFMSIHGYRYLRLDGATKPEQRQMLTERFNNDNRILAFILSSRSGGIGVNLTGADTVIFYDLDWNPAMDKQCQDRCHRIGQTRDVHIYRLVSENTIEANILRKANQKRLLDDVVIQEGEFTTDYFNNMSVRDIVGDSLQLDDADEVTRAAMDRVLGNAAKGKALEAVEDQDDAKAAKEAEKEVVANDAQDFSEDKDQQSVTQTAAKLDSYDENNAYQRNHNANGVEVTTTMEAAASGLVIPEEPAIVELGPSCDDFMIRFKDWELKDEPIQPPIDKKKKKKKQGKESLGRKK